MTSKQKQETEAQIKALETVRNTKRRHLFDTQDEIDKQRNDLIEKIAGKLKQQATLSELFCMRWKLV